MHTLQLCLIASASMLALSACSTVSPPAPVVEVMCEPLPATLRVRPQPLPPLRTTQLKTNTPASVTFPNSSLPFTPNYGEVSSSLIQILDLEESRCHDRR